VGGDTIWVNMAEAYRRLPDDIKARIEGLRARHSIEASFGANMPIEARLALHERFPDAEHPVVRTHPETGEKVLFVNAFTTHFTNFHTPRNVRFGQDYNPGASQLLAYLVSQAFEERHFRLPAQVFAGQAGIEHDAQDVALAGRPGAYAFSMHTVELTDEELRIVREALRSYLDDFGHEEADILQLLKAILAKLPEPE